MAAYYVGYPRKASLGIGITHVIMGVLVMVMQIALLGTDKYHGVTYLAQGIWCGIIYIIAGTLGILAGKNGHQGLVVASLTVCIMTMFLNITLFITTVTWSIIKLFDPNYYYYDLPYGGNSCSPDPYYSNHTCVYNTTGYCFNNGTQLNLYNCSEIYYSAAGTGSVNGGDLGLTWDKKMEMIYMASSMTVFNFLQFAIALAQSIISCMGICGQTDKQARMDQHIAGYATHNQSVVLSVPTQKSGSGNQRLFRMPNGQYALMLDPAQVEGTDLARVTYGPGITPPTSCSLGAPPPYNPSNVPEKMPL